MKNKKVLALMMAMAFVASVASVGTTSLTVNAQELTQATDASEVSYHYTTDDEKDLLKGLFDLEYYKEQNPELVAVLGDDYDMLFEHFCMCGIYEGRTCNVNFNPSAYASAYGDLKEKYGKNIMSYYVHYITEGAAENRTITTLEACANAGIVVESLSQDSIVIEPAVYMFAKDHGFNDYGAMQSAVTRAEAEAQAGNNSTVVLKPDFGKGNYWVVKNYPEALAEAKGLTEVGTITVPTTGGTTVTYYIYRDTNGLGAYDSADVLVYNTEGYAAATKNDATYVAEVDVTVSNDRLNYNSNEYNPYWPSWYRNDLHVVHTYNYEGDLPEHPVTAHASVYDEDGNYLQPDTWIGTNYVAHKTTVDGVYTASGEVRPIEESDNIPENERSGGGSSYMDDKNDSDLVYHVGLELEDKGDNIEVTVGIYNDTTGFAEVDSYMTPDPDAAQN